MEKKKTSEYYKNKILDCLSNEFFGLTITKLADKINVNRNTVSKYLNILEAEGKVFNEKVATATVYFSRKKSVISFDMFIGIYKSYIGALRKVFPDDKEAIKQMGRIAAEYPYLKKFFYGMRRVKRLDYAKRVETFKKSINKFWQFFEFIFGKTEFKNVLISSEKNKIIYRVKSGQFLEKNGEFLFHYYIISGFLEKRVLDIFNIEIKCNITDYDISQNGRENYIILEFEFPEID